MDNVYDLHRHSDCAIIYMGKKHTAVYLCPNLRRSSSNSKNITINKNRVIYNKDKSTVLDWGNAYTYNENKDDVHIENFRDELYEAFKKENSQWGEDDKSLLQTVSDFIHRTVKASMESHVTEIATMDAIHYAFVIPSLWDEDIAKIMIQSIFIRSNLISKGDHSDRLLFFTDIESIFYGFGEINHQGYCFKRGQNTILSQLSLFENSTVSVKLDLISTMNTRFDFDDSKLFPKVVRTASLVFSYEGIKDSIKLFFESKLFPGGTNAEQDRVMDMVAAFKFDIGDLTIDRYDKFEYDEHPFYEYDDDDYDDDGDFNGNDDGEDARSKTDCTQSNTNWRLNKTQKDYIRSVSLIELCDEISEPLLESLRDLISNNCVKKYDFLVLQDSYSSSLTYSRTQAMRNFSLISWLKIMLECNRARLSLMTTVFDPQLAIHPISLGDIVSGASLGVIENVQNSDMYCKPRIVPKKDIPTSSSTFFNARPNSIINIDISYKSTLLSCSILSDDGLVTEILDHNYFIAGKCLPSLDSFYEVLNETTLNVKDRFISFAETYLLDELNLFFIDNDASAKEEIMREIEAILKRSYVEDEIPVTTRRRDHLKIFLRTYKDYIKESIFKKDPPDHKSSFFEDALVSIKQKKYIKAFFGMYMIYLKELISSKFPVHLQSEHTKTGYAVSIEKVILNNVIGTKEDFEKIIFASGLTRKDDEFQKLRIVTQGEGLLPFIRQSLNLEFPLKSYFVLAQLHEDYIQLTLHQIVTDPSPGEHQEAIIFHNEILSTQNIHDNLCLKMWNNIIQNNELIQLCNEHAASDYNAISELLSLKTKTEFMKNLSCHITNNILSDISDAKITETTDIQLNKSCRCKVYLTTYDILEVSFRPILQEIACTITTALINKDIFGKYPRIRYHFNLIYFNRNLLLQDTLANMLKEEVDDFNQDQGIETTFLTIPKLPHMISRPIINEQPLLYRAFQMGTLHQVFSEDYSFSIGYTPVGALKFFSSQSVDTESYVTKNDIAFSLLKKGGLISNTRSNKIFYFITDQNSCPKKINIGIQKLKEFNGLEHQQFDLIDTAYETIYSRIIYFKKSVIENGNVPIMISVEHQDYCSSLKLSVTILDKDINIPNFLQVGEPMTLTRF